MTGFLGVILVFGAIIAFHEFGHFIVAKLSGMTVHEFSIGFGPALLRFTRGGTLYALRIIPLGGYVRIAGMEPPAEGEDAENPDDANSYEKKPFYAKFATIAAGAAMNFVLALVIFIIMGMAVGYPDIDRAKTRVDAIVQGMPAHEAGIQPGDVIADINGVAYPNLEQTHELIRTSTPPIRVTVERAGQTQTYNLTPRDNPTEKRKMIGIQMEPYQAPYVPIRNPIEAVRVGAVGVYRSTVGMVQGIGMMFQRPKETGGVMGPVNIIRITNHFASQAFVSREDMARFLSLFALISMNIGLINLFPIPALDGSRLAILTIERIRRKPFDRRKEAYVHMVGLILLLALVLIITVRETGMWIQGQPPIPGGMP